MAASYRIDRELRTVFSQATGLLTDKDLSLHQADLLADPSFDASFDQLWDLRAITDTTVTQRALRQLASSRSYTPESRRAIVAPHDLSFGLSRMFQLLHDSAPEEICVFRNLDEARNWLGLR